MMREDMVPLGMVIGGVVAGLVIFAMGYITGYGMYDPWSQANFPCAEDEALIYAPQFGPDRVGCMHVEGGQLAPEVWEVVR